MAHPESATRALLPGDVFVHTTPSDPLVAPLLADLEREYDQRYGNMFGEPAAAEINRYPASAFSAPDGTFALLVRDGRAISGGAFMLVGPGTVEVNTQLTCRSGVDSTAQWASGETHVDARRL
jgi:hypothetical protein